MIKGCCVAIVTPFEKGRENIDFGLLKRHTQFLVDSGVDAILACGTTGESATLSMEENIAITQTILDTCNKKIPVFGGAGANDTRKSIKLVEELTKIGVDGFVVVTPYYNKTTQNGLITHYTQIADSTELPIMLYNVPGRTGLNMLPKTVYELSKVKNIAGVKEASGDISQITEIAALCGDDFELCCGNDDQILPFLALGGKSVVSVAANIIPKDVTELINSFLDGDIAKSRKLQLGMINLVKALFCETSPMPVKEALSAMGFSSRRCRAPLFGMEDHNKKFLLEELKNYGLVK